MTKIPKAGQNFDNFIKSIGIFSTNVPEELALPDPASFSPTENELDSIKKVKEIILKLLRELALCQKVYGKYKKELTKLVDVSTKKLNKSKRESRLAELQKENTKLKSQIEEMKKR